MNGHGVTSCHTAPSQIIVHLKLIQSNVLVLVVDEDELELFELELDELGLDEDELELDEDDLEELDELELP